MSSTSGPNLVPEFYTFNDEKQKLLEGKSVNMTSIIDLFFTIGGSLYLIFDFVLVLVVFQRTFRPMNENENRIYSVIIQILIALGGLQITCALIMVCFTRAGKICSGSYLKPNDNEDTKDFYQIMESKFLMYNAICQITWFLILVTLIYIYRKLQEKLDLEYCQQMLEKRSNAYRGE